MRWLHQHQILLHNFWPNVLSSTIDSGHSVVIENAFVSIFAPLTFANRAKEACRELHWPIYLVKPLPPGRICGHLRLSLAPSADSTLSK